MEYIRRPSIIINVAASAINNDNNDAIDKQQQHRQSSMTRTAIYLLRFNVALQIALAAMAVNLFLAIATFYYGWNALYCAFGADSIIGVLTAIILVWRFASSKHEAAINNDDDNNNNNMDNERIPILNANQNININRHMFGDESEMHPFLRSLQSTIDDTPDDNRRELWSTFWLGQIMILSGFGVIIRSIIELVHEIIENVHHIDDDNMFVINDHYDMKPLYLLALISLAMNIILMGFKLFIYYHLDSNSMLIEGVNSFISALFAATTIISIQFHDRIEYLDQIVSILFGVFLIIYGIYNVLHTLAHTVIDLIKQRYGNRHQLLLSSSASTQRQLNLLNHCHNENHRRSSTKSLLRDDYLQLI
ncbi:hypothetical protein BLA29_003746 [Euroglyphus maynei]|uniref:Uncharacterized protein n=1 Tax=Euroglyphus maynei TaxID=6958 RepID=A0A1Y3BAD5_EURMA|nr:hypothetical protein BLA29_003746 [Euroglyphus maynei]